MQTIKIAFDIDGTLRCNAEERHKVDIEQNENITTLLVTLAKFKNTEIHVWSNRGADYAREIIVHFGLERFVKNYHFKTWDKNKDQDGFFWPDIAIDDQQRFDGGLLNLIVREK
jgi:FMN phosphatase YigB (HAD superfamily)